MQKLAVQKLRLDKTLHFPQYHQRPEIYKLFSTDLIWKFYLPCLFWAMFLYFPTRFECSSLIFSTRFECVCLIKLVVKICQFSSLSHDWSFHEVGGLNGSVSWTSHSKRVEKIELHSKRVWLFLHLFCTEMIVHSLSKLDLIVHRDRSRNTHDDQQHLCHVPLQMHLSSSLV